MNDFHYYLIGLIIGVIIPFAVMKITGHKVIKKRQRKNKEVVLNKDDFNAVKEYANMRNIPEGEGKRLELELFLSFYKKQEGSKE